MRTRFNVTGSERKRMVGVIAQSIGEKAKYLGMPSVAFEIGPFTVTKDGTLEFSDRTDSEMVEKLYEDLADAGFTFDGEEEPAEETKVESAEETEGESAEEAEDAPESEADVNGLVIGMPLAGFDPDSLERLQKLTDSKASLTRKALGADNLTIRVREDRVEFPWFDHLPAPETISAATAFIAALCKLAKECTRVTATDHPVESEKYAFRIFLLRLGLGGKENKDVRAELMKNLSGTAAFPNQEAADAFAAAQKAKRMAGKAETETAV